MHQQWIGGGEASPIVELHDLRLEASKTRAYLDLLDGPLAAPLAAAGVVAMGQYQVEGHADRLLLLRGFPSVPERRQAMSDFHGSPRWQRHRAEATGLVRDASVLLARTLAPTDRTRRLQVGQPCVLLVSELRYAESIGDFHLWLRLFLRKAGLDPVAVYATLESANDVPAVPVVANRTHHIALLPAGGGVPPLPTELRGMLRFSPEVLRLAPAPALVW
ncbi:MAG TPA: hypothetical protein VFE52_10410 [Devosia sp.]|jgi:hypothetical protein|nr:hypothetical protein [Devosia sp.]